MDLSWLVIPAAILLFVVRAWMIARSLKAAAANPTGAEKHALRAAKRSLTTHHDQLHASIAQPKQYLDAAKHLATVPSARSAIRDPRSGPVFDGSVDRRA